MCGAGREGCELSRSVGWELGMGQKWRKLRRGRVEEAIERN